MKKLTGPILLAAALIAHIGIVIATEEEYTFSVAEFAEGNNAIIEQPALLITEAHAGGNLPSFRNGGLYTIDEQELTW